MRRQLIAILFLTGFAGASASSFGQNENKADLAARVDALAHQVDGLSRELEESRVRLDEALLYLQRNQRAASEMSQVLSASEQAGFTFGINPKSRELLLSGWRKQLGEMQSAMRGGASVDKSAEPTARIRLKGDKR